MNKKAIKKYFNKKAQICYLQILILIIATFAFAYLLSSSSSTSNPKVDTDKDNNIKKINFLKIIGFIILDNIRKPILPMVSAADPLAGWACCEKNNNGNFCTYRPQSECNTNFRISPTECEETDFCKKGCCIGNSGTCAANTPKSNCQGNWFENANCNIQECKRGCCILGD